METTNLEEPKKVTMYKTSDGRLFENGELAKEHEKEVVLRKDLESFFDEFFYRELSVSDLVSEIMDRYADLHFVVTRMDDV